MLIEDDLTLVGLLKTLLEIEGFEIAIAGRTVLDQVPQFIQEQQPDAVLMDVHMRGANGLEILRQVRQDAEFDGVQMILTSGIDLTEQCLAAGANAFVLKPYIPDDLVKTIRTAIDPT
jgi:CheY-like chemotaxis protein